MSTVPSITATALGPPGPGKPLLLLGPAIGTTAGTLWTRCAAELAAEFEVLAWDLPGHGRSAPATDGFSIAELAEGVLALVEPGRPMLYAGDSMGAAVGLQLLLDHPDRVTAAALLCTGARIGSLVSEDVAQEAFARTLASGAEVRNPRAFLAKVAIRAALEEIRRRPEAGFAYEPVAAVQPEAEQALLLEQLIQALPGPIRDVFLFSRFGGLSNVEIAQRCNLSVKRVEARLTERGECARP